MTQDPISATAEDTGAISVPRGSPSPHTNGVLGKADWIRIIIWSVPIIFMAATMYVSVTHLTEKSVAHDIHLQKLDDVTSGLSTEQKVTSEKVGEVCKKQDKLMSTTEKMDDKLDGQGEDLTAIKAKLNIRHRGSSPEN